MIRSIVALDAAQGFADDNGIPWHDKLPGDAAYFLAHVRRTDLVMGRRTYDEFAGRSVTSGQNYVLTSQLETLLPGYTALDQRNLDTLLRDSRKDIWVIGGQSVYERAMAHVQELYITQLHTVFACTRFFPKFAADFEMTSESAVQEENGIAYTFQVWSRL